jgi:hypothetical protein
MRQATPNYICVSGKNRREAVQRELVCEATDDANPSLQSSVVKLTVAYISADNIK